jgi:hypothetical protein
MSQAKAFASLGVVDSKHIEPVSAWIWRARKVASTSDYTPSMSRSTIKVETDPILADFFGTFLFPTMPLTLFFFFLSNWTTYALLGQSLSHKTATAGVPSQSSEVVTERRPWGMVVRRREKKGGGRMSLLWKTKGMNKELNLWKNKGSNRPQRVPVEKKVHQCSHQWTGAPTDGQGAPVKKKAGIRWKEPASHRTPASHERCEREKEDSQF